MSGRQKMSFGKEGTSISIKSDVEEMGEQIPGQCPVLQ